MLIELDFVVIVFTFSRWYASVKNLSSVVRSYAFTDRARADRCTRTSDGRYNIKQVSLTIIVLFILIFVHTQSTFTMSVDAKTSKREISSNPGSMSATVCLQR